MDRSDFDKLELDIDCEITFLLNDPNTPLPRRNTIEALRRACDAIRQLRETIAVYEDDSNHAITKDSLKK